MLERIQAPSLVDEAHRQIRALILAGELKPGEPLRDSLLAEQMGISRSPVREALRMLETSGLVVKAMNRSYRISSIAVEDIPELTALRVADEVVAVRAIVENGHPIDELDAVLDQLRTARDVQQAALLDAAFHAKMVDLARFPRLSTRYSELRDQIRLTLLASDLESFVLSDSLVERHAIIVDQLREAIRSGDPAPVIATLEAHIVGGMQASHRHLSGAGPEQA